MTDASKVEFDSKNQNARIDSYTPNNDWHLISLNFSSIVTKERYNFYNDPENGIVYKNDDILFTVTLKRVSLYFMVNDIFPTLILNLITLLAYAIPYPQQLLISKLFQDTYF